MNSSSTTSTYEPPQTQYTAYRGAKALCRPRLGAKAPTTHRSATVYAQLVQRFHVQTIKVRDPWLMQSLWTTKILAHAICVWTNIRLKREPLDFDGLVQL